ncbi:alpha/beta fold hydrolase [Nitrospira sp. NS4]|uniref:alpha/beta fold hydrolase n=1 Tax=Nitrospira sp. NS4 TaxID=3414498 RepID=UPI003C30A76E
MMLGSCAAPDPLPPWFDSIERLPLKSVTVNGQRIAYLDQGQGPPVILIHGFGGSMWQWEYQQAALAGQFRVITPDLLGAGLSDKPKIEYRPDQLLEFLVGFMDALQIPQAAMVGNSMGAGIAIGLALDHPGRVSTLILIDGLPPGVMECLGSPSLRRALTTHVPSWLVSAGNWLFGGRMLESTLREFVHDPALLTPAVLDRSNRNRQRPGLFRALLTVGTNLPLWERDFAPRIGAITHRTLIIWGEEDRVFPLPAGETLHRTIAGSTFKSIPNAAHIPQWERPDLVNQAILTFLAP